MANCNILKINNVECTDRFMKNNSSNYLHVQGSSLWIRFALYKLENYKKSKLGEIPIVFKSSSKDIFAALSLHNSVLLV